MAKRRTWRAKFSDAFRGLWAGVRGQSSFVAHLGVALAVIVMAAVLRLPLVQWVLLLLAMGLVLVAELLNTSLEWLARAVTSEQDERIGRALDIAAGAVLLASLLAALVGLLVLGPPLWALAAPGGVAP